MAAVSVRDVSIAFGSMPVLDRLSIEVAAGEFLVLLGPSGCGKSTLLNAMAGLIDVEDGEIHFGERNVTWEEPKDRGVAMVFQSYALYPRMSVRENLSFGLRMARTQKAEIEARVARAAAMLQIEHLLDRRPSELSGGQRQRVAIGRALVRDADIFLFDEPLSNLDAQLRNELRVEIKRLHQRLADTTMIYVTHDQIEALTLADRVAVMKDRRIQQLAPPAEIYNRPANLFVAGFVGSPRMNFVEGRIEAPDGALVFRAGDRRLALDAYEFARRPAPGSAATLGVRPEHIGVLEAGEDVHAWSGLHVDIVEPMGADSLVWCRDGETTLAVRMAGEKPIAPGAAVRLVLDPARASLFDPASGERL
ncbi:ABC transporter ATP-binding protein [Salinarimonas ramus]|uniref:ABC transporter ATP-binding protein n=1 Tax=Salinarimonas ramus TaxID=690164 RepID=A0A917V5J9_9HYPH|nr:ABC transporter ATP-binding protein [Salinarimonas ramus]GGK39793.1 ABC transporter ATP-binding protein [Salinarimonas ramus]